MATEQIFLQQVRNAANTTLDVILAQVNTAIGLAFSQANSAFSQANNAVSIGNQALSVAGGAFNQANTATAVGQAAFAQANSAASSAASAAAAASAAQTTANEGIAASGVTAGGYGTGTAIPNFEVDARGRITFAETVAIPTFSPGTNGLVQAPTGSSTSLFLSQNGQFILPLGGLDQSVNNPGWTTLPGGMILQWGRFAGQPSSPATVSFPRGFPDQAFVVTATPIGAFESFDVVSLNASNFTYNFGASNTPIFWMAIGF
jgi:hypothetical protein